MPTAQEVIQIALAEDGYFGKKNATDNLDIKEAPNGTGEYTKYARDLYEAGYYNGNKQGADGHCTIFADWVLWVAMGKPKKADLDNATCLNPVNANGAGAPFNAGCYAAWGLLDDKPKLGDKIYLCYKNSDGSIGDAYHMGLVVAIDGDILTTMEGNTKNSSGEDNAYCKKTRKLDTTRMRFGHPRYSEKSETDALKEQLEAANQQIAELNAKVSYLEKIYLEAEAKASKFDTIKTLVNSD